MWLFACCQENVHSDAPFLAVDDLSQHPTFGRFMFAHIPGNGHMCVLKKAVIERLLQLPIIGTIFAYTVVRSHMSALCRYEFTDILHSCNYKFDPNH
jgi:hypothetical protein